jgi:hypothetical protein
MLECLTCSQEVNQVMYKHILFPTKARAQLALSVTQEPGEQTAPTKRPRRQQNIQHAPLSRLHPDDTIDLVAQVARTRHESI